MELAPVPFPNPLEVLYSKPRTVAFAPLMFVMLPPKVAPVVLMEVTVELVVTVGAEAEAVDVTATSSTLILGRLPVTPATGVPPLW